MVPAEFDTKSLKGCFFPLLGKKPCFVCNEDVWLLPVFSDLEKYKEYAENAGFQSATPIMIMDCELFIKNVIQLKKTFKFHLAMNPYAKDGKTVIDMIVLDENDVL